LQILRFQRLYLPQIEYESEESAAAALQLNRRCTLNHVQLSAINS
jgi:hypothetical protein